MVKLATSCSTLGYAMAGATIAAATAAEAWIGRGDEQAAEEAAARAMRDALNAIDFSGRVIVGEADISVLNVGEAVGTGEGIELDVALEALEGTTLTAKAMPNALAVIAAAPRGGLLQAPDLYMEKLAIGPGFARGTIDLDAGAGENAVRLAKAKGVHVREITACVLDRPRHEKIIADLRSVGARINLIPDGDVAGAIAAAMPEAGIDMYVGQGKAPEGVLAAAALRCVGGQMQARFAFRNEAEKYQAQRSGLTDIGRRYELDDLVKGDVIFSATGVTKGSLLDGVGRTAAGIATHTMLMSSADGVLRMIRSVTPQRG
ncbi:MAG: fructose-bisphosphatase class II [Alphaproteobacteria bacterium 32-64-14]|nr:MAG: fructose-bisphosphatase class II [Alphaproteobacteria bacterium 32-64-14]